MKLIRFPVIMTLAAATASCGHSSSDTIPELIVDNASAAGIWVGTDSASGLALTGIVNGEGEADFIRSDGTQYVGTVDVANTTLTLPLNVFAEFGTPFADGSSYAVGTLNATVATTSSISGTVTYQTSASTAVNSNWSLTFSSLYNTSSTLSDVSGNYSDASTIDPVGGATVSISSGGVISAQSATTGCVLNGALSNTNTATDAYQVSYTVASCTGADAVLNGIEFTGLALLNKSASPAQVVIGVKGQADGGPWYGLVSTLTLD